METLSGQKKAFWYNNVMGQTAQKNNFYLILSDLGLLIFAGLIFYYWNDNPELAFGQIQFILFILLITLFTRSVSTRYGIGMYGRGLFLGTGITLLIGAGYRALGFDPGGSFFASSLFFPTLEEILKLFPVLLSAYLLYRKNPDQQWNISDWVMLGMMSGTAFGMSEDYYREGYLGEHFGPHFGNVYLFPDATGFSYGNGNEAMGYIGHGAATAFITLAIGLGFYCSKKFNKKPLCWQIPLLAFIWVTFEHMANNAGDESDLMLKIFGLLGGGHLTPWLFLILLLGGVGIDAKNFIHAYKTLPKFKKIALFGVEKTKNFVIKKTWPPLSFMKGCFRALRFLNRAAWHYFFKT